MTIKQKIFTFLNAVTAVVMLVSPIVVAVLVVFFPESPVELRVSFAVCTVLATIITN